LALKFISEIGIGLAGFGIAFLTLGVIFLFDKGLLAIGNVFTFCQIMFHHLAVLFFAYFFL
jgi:PREDICTED: similar to CGI-141 protein, partial